MASVSPILMEPSDLESCESVRMEFDLDAVEVKDLPYLEVCTSVSNVDDPEMPTLLFRMWVIGLVLCITELSLSVFLNFHQPAAQVIRLIFVLISYPIGKLTAYLLPMTTL